MSERLPVSPARSRAMPPSAKRKSSSSTTRPKVSPNIRIRARKPGLSEPLTIVAVGASAGGLEAFNQLLHALPDNTGMAFVFIQHLDPAHRSLLSELLGKRAKMPVVEAKHGTTVEANHVYVIPPNVNMGILRQRLQLTPRAAGPALHTPIDFFMQSLAEARNSRSIGVVLSGTASDGTRGLAAIKAEGGITFAQEEKSAKYSGMPRSAIASGFVDFVLPPGKIGRELVRISGHLSLSGDREPTPPTKVAKRKTSDESFDQIHALLRKIGGINFSKYKPGTIQRRTLRRMAIHKIEHVSDYAKYLEKHPEQTEQLCQDLLIPVTKFFRDPHVFRALKAKVFPAIAKDKTNKGTIRIWAPGCSTGEETYSLAILLLEYLGDKAPHFQIQLFGTDVNQRGVEKARAGIYPEAISQEVSSERLRRFFTKIEGGYRVSKSIRDLCVFAKQNLAEDPPFSQMNLVVCRNMLIYLGTELQKTVMPILHYALRPSGFLLLGNAESVEAFPDLFASVDKKHKIYKKKLVKGRPYYDFSAKHYPREKAIASLPNEPGGVSLDIDRQGEADRMVLKKYAPASVVIGENMEVLQFRGDIGRYVELTSERATLNLLKLARKEFVAELRIALDQAQKNHSAAQRKSVEFQHNGLPQFVNISVEPLRGTAKTRQYLIVFETAVPSSLPVSRTGGKLRGLSPATKEEIASLRRKLATSEGHFRSLLESKEADDETYQSANEEILSANEELQSTNEELETSQEELQSVNEELNTVNDELQHRNTDLDRVNSDLKNVLSSTSLPVVMVDRELRIRRLTPASAKIFKMLPSDIGRPIGDIRSDIDVPNLDALIGEVIDTLTPKEWAVQDKQEHWYSMQIRPYRTTNDQIDGAVVVLSDIHEAKQLSERLRKSKDFMEDTLETLREPLLVLGADLKVQYANRSFLNNFAVSSEQTRGQFLFDLGNGQWEIPQLRAALTEVVSAGAALLDFEVEHDFPGLGLKTMLLNARRIEDGHGDAPLMVLAIDDITERKRVENALRESEEMYRSLFGAIPVAVFVCDRNGTIQGYNPRAVELWGREPERGVERHCGSVKLWLPDGSVLPHELSPLAEVLRSGESVFNVEIFIERPDGSRLPVLVNFAALKDAHGRVTGGVTSFIDITERKQAEKEVRAAAERFRFLAETMPQKIFTARPNGEVDYFNPQWTEFTGLSLDQIRDWGWTQFVHPDHLEETVHTWKHATATGEAFRIEHRFRRADGKYRWHLSQARGMQDAAGAIVMWTGSSTDVDDLKQAEQVLEDRVAARTAAVRHLSIKVLTIQDEEHRSLSRELHDSLGQHLAGMKMCVDRMRQGESSTQPAELLSQVSQSLDHCISETRTISHLLHPPLIDELGFSAAAKWYIEEFSQRSGIQVKHTFAEDSRRLAPSVELPLFRVLQASLSNIHRHAQTPSVDVLFSINTGEAKLEVKDYGKGINRELLRRFNLTGTGAGVGLTGMRERMLELGGRLEIESNDGGTVVRAVIPVDAPVVAQEARRA